MNIVTRKLGCLNKKNNKLLNSCLFKFDVSIRTSWCNSYQQESIIKQRRAYLLSDLLLKAFIIFTYADFVW